MLTAPDVFDKIADNMWAERKAGVVINKEIFAHIARSTWQLWQVEHPITPATLPATKRTRARNPLFDALAESTGSNPSNLTRAGGSAIASALAEIKEVSPEVTPEEIHQAALTYRRLHRDWSLTATALSKHWAEVSGGSQQTKSRKLDPYLPPPNDWKIYAAKRFPGTLVSVTPWEELTANIRTDILQIIP